MVQVGRLPIVSHHEVDPSAAQLRRLAQLAAALEHEQPSLIPQPWIRQLSVSRIEDGGVLHLDDVDEIPLLDRFYDARFLPDRARLRAGDHDFVASCAPADHAFERTSVIAFQRRVENLFFERHVRTRESIQRVGGTHSLIQLMTLEMSDETRETTSETAMVLEKTLLQVLLGHGSRPAGSRVHHVVSRLRDESAVNLW